MKLINFLAILCAISAITLETVGNGDLFKYFKPLTTILIILIPVFYGRREFKKYTFLTIFALIFCLFGDIFLLKESQFVWGLVSFLIAHILFTLSFIAIDKFKFYRIPIILLSLFGIFYYGYIYNALDSLAIPVLFYFIFIIIMCWQGISLYIWRKKTAFRFIAIAVVLFLFSDSIIALDKFKFPFELERVLVLSSYWLSILLLANAPTIIHKD